MHFGIFVYIQLSGVYGITGRAQKLLFCYRVILLFHCGDEIRHLLVYMYVWALHLFISYGRISQR